MAGRVPQVSETQDLFQDDREKQACGECDGDLVDEKQGGRLEAQVASDSEQQNMTAPARLEHADLVDAARDLRTKLPGGRQMALDCVDQLVGSVLSSWSLPMAWASRLLVMAMID